MPDFDIEAALKEVQEKSEEEVEIETAYKWASRSCACYKLHKDTQLIKWLLKGEDYRHESLEHAALAKDGGKTLKIIENEIEKHRTTINDKEEAPVKDADIFELRFQKLSKLFGQE